MRYLAPYPPTRRHYSIDGRLVRYPVGSRPNKLAAGMQFTHARNGSKQGELSRDALKLAVWGTCDPLAFSNKMTRYRSKYYKAKTITIYVKKAAA